MTLFYCDPKEDVMIPKQSTTALPDRLTQGFYRTQTWCSGLELISIRTFFLVALFPHIHKYLPTDCGESKLDFFGNTIYSREKCLQARTEIFVEIRYKFIKNFNTECAYKSVMDMCKCRPPYFPSYKNYSDCSFSMHASCISPNFTVFNFTTCTNCPIECEKYR